MSQSLGQGSLGIVIGLFDRTAVHVGSKGFDRIIDTSRWWLQKLSGSFVQVSVCKK